MRKKNVLAAICLVGLAACKPAAETSTTASQSTTPEASGTGSTTPELSDADVTRLAGTLTAQMKNPASVAAMTDFLKSASIDDKRKLLIGEKGLDYSPISTKTTEAPKCKVIVHCHVGHGDVNECTVEDNCS